MKRLLPVLLLAACGMDVDQVEDVEDLRILALRADPPEVLINTAALNDATDLSALEVDVTFDALVVDPRGGVLDFEWRFCPIESFEACRDFETIRVELVNVVRGLIAD
ncbi:MAG: hypothetical protein AAFX94_23805, partial [Myxococcota bacterium]